MILTRARALPSDPRARALSILGQEAREPRDRWTGYSALAAFHSAPGVTPPGGPPPFPTLELSNRSAPRQEPPHAAGLTQPVRGRAKAAIGWFLKSARHTGNGLQRAAGDATSHLPSPATRLVEAQCGCPVGWGTTLVVVTSPGDLNAYLSAPSELLDEIRSTARRAALAGKSPQVQVSTTEKYGLFGNKTRTVSKDAGYWVLKTVIEYGIQEPVSRERGNGNITDLERDERRSYCLAADGELFSFTHETEGALVDRTKWEVFVDRTGEREPFESNLDVFLADFDFTVFVDRTTPYFRERFMSVGRAVGAAEGSLAGEYNWSTGVTRRFDSKGRGLLEHLQQMA